MRLYSVIPSPLQKKPLWSLLGSYATRLFTGLPVRIQSALRPAAVRAQTNEVNLNDY